MKKILSFIGLVLTVALATFALVRGVHLQDLSEIARNATTICLSCMGIQ